MCDHDKRDADRELLARIARFMQAKEEGNKNQISNTELQALTAATKRLDRLLAKAAEVEGEDLRAAASRLDQLLKDISEGKNVQTAFCGGKQPVERTSEKSPYPREIV
jgi:hypothetical protein